MKKLLALLLVLVMVLSLAACAAKTETADAPAEKPAPTETAPAEETKEPEQAEEPAVEEQPVEAAEPVELTVFAAASLTESRFSGGLSWTGIRFSTPAASTRRPSRAWVASPSSRALPPRIISRSSRVWSKACYQNCAYFEVLRILRRAA